MKRLLAVALLLACLPVLALAKDSAGPAPKPAIVLAAFGSTSPSAQLAQDTIMARMRAAFPDLDVRLAITSRAARHAAGPDKAPSPLTVMARLSDEGRSAIVLQPLLISAGDEYADLAETARALASISAKGTGKKPFTRIVLAAPVLGASPDGDPSDLADLAKALAPEITQAGARTQTVVFVAHGNAKRHDKAVANLRKALAKAYPKQTVLAGGMDSKPGLAETVQALKAAKAKNVLVMPLLVSTGVHAAKEICGQEPDSWRTALEQAGFAVDCRAKGLGELEAFADIYVEHVRRALKGFP